MKKGRFHKKDRTTTLFFHHFYVPLHPLMKARVMAN